MFWKCFHAEISLYIQVILCGIIAPWKEVILPPHPTSGESQALREESAPRLCGMWVVNPSPGFPLLWYSWMELALSMPCQRPKQARY